MHWATQYIGKPWVSGARGPDAFDCWGLTRWVYAQHYGVELPAFVGVDANDHVAVRRLMREEELRQRSRWPDWTQLAEPTDGCAVLMGGLERLHHVGVYLALPEGGGVLHCKQPAGVTFQTVAELRAAGIPRILFYQHARHP